MTELSVQYACSPAIGDYGPLTVENLAIARLMLGNKDITDAGLIYWTDSNFVPQLATTGTPGGLSNAVDGLLEPADAGGGVVSIQTGVAIVNGYIYFSDEEETFDINGNPGNANATDIIALRWTAASQAVRLTRIAGAAASTAVLTQTTSTWDMPIVEVVLDAAGELSSITDVRKLAVSPGTVMKIEEYLADGSTATVTFSGIQPVFKHLLIKGYGRITYGVSAKDTIGVQFNGDAGNNYDYRIVFVVNGTFSHTAAAAAANMVLAQLTTTTGVANYADNFEININNYKDSTFYKAAIGHGQSAGDATTGASGLSTNFGSGWWQDTSPITSVTIFSTNSGNFVSGTIIELYGIV